MDRSESEAIFKIEVAIAELIISSETQTRTVIARIERMETIVMTTLADIQTKLGTLSSMLDAKAKSDDADLTSIGTQIDEIIEAHTPVATTSTSTTTAVAE